MVFVLNILSLSKHLITRMDGQLEARGSCTSLYLAHQKVYALFHRRVSMLRVDNSSVEYLPLSTKNVN